MEFRLVPLERACQTCRVLRRFVAASAISGLFGALGGCSPTAPIDLGFDYAPPLATDGAGGSGSGEPGPEMMPEPGSFDPLYEAAADSEYCSRPFVSCGGRLAGTWVVEDTCRAETRNRTALRIWGRTMMDLDAPACGDAAQRMTTEWSGILKFEEGMAIDERERLRTLDLELKATCIGASFGVDEVTSSSPMACEAMQDDMTTCGLTSGVCHCTSRTMDPGRASGVYGVLERRVAIGDAANIYEYCVDGDRLIWNERSSATPIVFRRVEDGAGPDPIGFPR